MHETLSPNFKGFIDNFYIEDGNLRISGWLITTHDRDDIVYFSDIGHNIAFYNYNDRQDVADFYSTSDNNYLKCGFDFSVPTPNVEEIKIFALVKGQKENIFTLEKNMFKRLYVESTLVDETYDIKINNNIRPDIIVVDNFYKNPDEIRKIALEQTYVPDLRYHKGQRTQKKFLAEGTKQIFESLIGKRITNWVDYDYNGIFQYCTPEDLLVIHSDLQNYAGAVYLTPNAPVETGTSFYRSRKYTNIRKCHIEHPQYNDVFENNYYDKTRFELVDKIGNVYNRLVLWDATMIHMASEYFGTNKDNSRLFHLFFFDIEE